MFGLLAEIKLRRGLEAIDAVSEKNLVRIQRENLRLGKVALDLDGEHRFLHFALPTAVRREEEVAGELHRERGCALYLAAGLDITVGGADDTPEIDSGVTVEILVFDGYERIAQHRRKIVVAGNDAALQGE